MADRRGQQERKRSWSSMQARGNDGSQGFSMGFVGGTAGSQVFSRRKGWVRKGLAGGNGRWEGSPGEEAVLEFDASQRK